MYRDIADFKAQHKAAGGHFFDRGAMRFFNSRIESTLLKGGYFITSETYNEDGPRFYQIRMVDESDPRDVKTLNEHHATKAEAMEVIRDLRKRRGQD